MKVIITIPLLIFAYTLSIAQESVTDTTSNNLLDVLRDRKDTTSQMLEKYSNRAAITVESDVSALQGNNPPIRDPFNLSGQTGIPATGNRFGPSTFLPNSDQQKIPKLKLKGVINADKKAPKDLLALLEIDNREVYMVRVGDEISYDPSKPNSAIKIVTISRLSVTVQVGSLGNVLIVR